MSCIPPYLSIYFGMRLVKFLTQVSFVKLHYGDYDEWFPYESVTSDALLLFIAEILWQQDLGTEFAIEGDQHVTLIDIYRRYLTFLVTPNLSHLNSKDRPDKFIIGTTGPK